MPMGFQMMSWRLLAKSTSDPISIPETAGSPRRFQNTQSVSLGCQKTGFKLFLRCPNCWSGERVWRTLGFAHLTNAPQIHQKQITSGHGKIAKLLDWTLVLPECWKSFWEAVFPRRFQDTQNVGPGCPRSGFKLFLRSPECLSGERVRRSLGLAHLTNAPHIHRKQITGGHNKIAKLRGLETCVPLNVGIPFGKLFFQGASSVLKCWSGLSKKYVQYGLSVHGVGFQHL